MSTCAISAVLLLSIVCIVAISAHDSWESGRGRGQGRGRWWENQRYRGNSGNRWQSRGSRNRGFGRRGGGGGGGRGGRDYDYDYENSRRPIGGGAGGGRTELSTCQANGCIWDPAQRRCHDAFKACGGHCDNVALTGALPDCRCHDTRCTDTGGDGGRFVRPTPAPPKPCVPDGCGWDALQNRCRDIFNLRACRGRCVDLSMNPIIHDCQCDNGMCLARPHP